MPNKSSGFGDIVQMLDDLVTYDPRLRTDVGFLKTRLSELHQKATAPGAKPADQAEYHHYMEGLAEGLPELTTGVIGAVQAFKDGDPFAETAAVLGLCATLSSTLGALAGPSAGPPGALLGAVFSMVSMILSIWIPKGPPLIEQIEGLLRQLQAESKLQKLGAAEEEIRKFVYMVQEVHRETGAPLHTESGSTRPYSTGIHSRTARRGRPVAKGANNQDSGYGARCWRWCAGCSWT